MSGAPQPVEHVVIMVQENHTIDNYFRALAPYGANVATGWPLTPNPPAHDQAHDRHAYFEWLTGKSSGEHSQFDTAAVLPYYLYLAVTCAFLENHCAGFGTNSTPNHLLIVGGQSPTLKNPSRQQPQPVWDLPSLPGLPTSTTSAGASTPPPASRGRRRSAGGSGAMSLCARCARG